MSSGAFGSQAAPQGVQRLTIGRNPASMIHLERKGVSWDHAILHVEPGGRMAIQDLNSTNGTYRNSRTDRVQMVEVFAGDTVYFGDLPLAVSRMLEFLQHRDRRISVGTGGAMEALAFRGESMLLGRSPQADIRLDHPSVSWEHARIQREGSRHFLVDLNSTNGTYYRGERLRGRVEIALGDEIRLGVYSFKLNAQGVLEKRNDERDITVEVRDLVVQVPDRAGSGLKTLLYQVSLVIEPGELVALMGPSGAGKTTLLDAMNGMRRPTQGWVLYSGKSLYDYYDCFRYRVGYVPQDDIMHTQLTIYEALDYTARLRLPAGTSRQEIEHRIRAALEAVSLYEDPAQTRSPVQYRLIGEPGKKGISGGQRKRVNLAMELLADPTVLFLDEPTSGLSSTDARNVVSQLRRLADAGKTIIVTIHQPGYDVYEKFHCLAMVSNHKDPQLTPDQQAAQAAPPGQLTYFGPAEKAFEFFESPSSNGLKLPDQFFDSMHGRGLDYWTQKFWTSPQSPKRYYVDQRQGVVPEKQWHKPLEPVRKHRFTQWRTLAGRLLKLKRRDVSQLAMMALAPLVLGLLIAQLKPVEVVDNYKEWIKFCSRLGTTHFLMVVGAIWFGCNNAVREIVGERAVFRRERMVNLSLISYLGSKVAVLAMICLAQCALLLTIPYWASGLQSGWLATLAVLWLVSLVGIAVGLCWSAVAPTNEFAVVSLPLLLLPMIVLGGGIIPLHSLRSSSPVLAALSDVAIPSRWAYETNFLLENRGRDLRLTAATPEELEDQMRNPRQAPPEHPKPDVAEQAFPESQTRHSFAQGVAVLCVMLMAGLGACFAALKWPEWRAR
jgi:ABC-type multidrug transport system ATPase subunit